MAFLDVDAILANAGEPRTGRTGHVCASFVLRSPEETAMEADL
jgi:hypothetical protein